MSDDDKVELGIGAEGGSLAVAGDAAGRFGHQIADFLSPLTEGFGLIGDHVRIWRQEAVLRALENFHKEARERDVPLRPVPPKMLVRWIEGASLEDDEELSKKWARLLLHSSRNSSNEYVWAANILSNLSPSEAVFLDNLYGRAVRNLSDHSDVLYNRYAEEVEREANALNGYIREYFKSDINKKDEESIRLFLRKLVDERDFAKNSIFCLISIIFTNEKGSDVFFELDKSEEKYAFSARLEALNLVDRVGGVRISDSDYVVVGHNHLEHVVLTRLGILFMNAVT